MGQAYSIPPGATVLDFARFLGNVRTGDVILFSGRGFFSSFIRCGSLGKNWSHVGVVVVETDASGTRTPFLIDSNTPVGLHDFASGRDDKSGPQMVNLAQRIIQYDGYFVAARYLDPSVESEELREAWRASLVSYVKSLPVSAKYDTNPADFWGASMRANVDGTPNYYCTEFAAAALQHAGIIEAPIPCENYTLDDFRFRIPTRAGLRYGEPAYLELGWYKL